MIIFKNLTTIIIAYLISGFGISISILVNINLAEHIYGDLSLYDSKTSLGYLVLAIFITGLLPAICFAPILLLFSEKIKLYLIVILAITQAGVYAMLSDNNTNGDLANLISISCLPTYFAFILSMYVQQKVQKKLQSL